MGALLQMNPTRLRRTVQDERHDNALAAARAGVEYALGRLAEDQEWRGAGSGITVQGEHMVVREDRGNVWGWLRSDNGQWAGFRIRFNYQDGNPGLDGLPDPEHPMPTAAISLNNLHGASGVGLPLGTGANFAFQGERGFLVPEHSVALVVEGLVGEDLSPDAFEASAQALTRTLEGVYQVSSLGEGVPEGAVLQAGGDSTFLLGDGPEPGAEEDDFSGSLRLAASDQTALMRTKGISTIGQAVGKTAPFNFYPDMHAEVRVGSGFKPFTKAGQVFTKSSEEMNAALMEVEWNKVAQSDQPGRLRLPAGVYAIADESAEQRVQYYPMTFSEYREALVSGQKPVAAPVPSDFMAHLELGANSSGQPRRDRITFDRDVEVEAVGALKDFAIVPAAGAKQKSHSDGTATISATRFQELPSAERHQTGTALVAYLKSLPEGANLDFEVGNVQYRQGEFVSGSPAELAQAVLGRETITFHGPAPTLVGGVPKLGGGVGPGGGADDQIFTIKSQTLSSSVSITDPNRLLAAAADFGTVPTTVLERGIDPLEVPSSALSDDTVPQDLEVRFAPAPGESATIRSAGNVLLGAQVGGKGGAVVAEGRIDLVGLGVDLTAGVGQRDSVSLYSKSDINISTYDERNNRYGDVSIKGVIFSRGNLDIRLGEVVTDGKEPSWGKFDLLGAAIVLGGAPTVIVDPTFPGNNYYDSYDPGTDTGGGGNGEGEGDGQGSHLAQLPGDKLGNASITARGVRLFYDPKFLTPYVKAERVLPIFAPVSVVER
jgi:hypothetical protein